MSVRRKEDELSLPFSHGMEVELQIIRKDGTWIKGEEILDLFNKLISNAKTHLDNRIRNAELETVRSKFKHSTQTEEGERGSRIVVSYEDPSGISREYTLLGHDPNVTSLTWILEIATPPCTTLQELAWWLQNLIAISFDALPKDARAIIVSTGLNPTQEYLKNLSFGEHHHILSPDVDERTRLAVYNMIRNFIPHLIAVSVNSPFENKVPSDEVRVDEKGRTRAPKCKRSIRLAKNTTQLGPTSEFELIPYLVGADKEGFARHVNRSYARMVDMYPFTDYQTIELRIFDTQLSIPRRIAIVLILQALALKARKLVEDGRTIPDAGAQSLSQNRESAVTAGLWGPFRPTTARSDPEFAEIYNHTINDDGTVSKTRNRFLGDAVSSMLFYIRNELEELNAIDNPFMQPLLISIFGSELVEPRTTGADFQLDVYAKSDMNMVVLLNRLADITRECCTNWLYDPLEGTPKLPTWLCWWKGLEPSIIVDKERIFAGQKAYLTISLKNQTDRPLTNLTLAYTIEDAKRNLIQENMIPVSRIDIGEIHLTEIDFQTASSTSAYNIIVNVGITGKTITLTGTVNTYWLKSTIRPGTTTQFADGSTPVVFSCEIETNYPRRTQVDCEVSVVAMKKEKTLAKTKLEAFIESSGTLILKNNDFDPLVIPADADTGVQRCLLDIRVFDKKRNMISSAVSRPFYVGFVLPSPKVLLRTDLREAHNPGDTVNCELSLKLTGKKISGDAEVRLRFTTDAGSSYDIVTSKIADMLEETLKVKWKVPTITSESPEKRTGLLKAELIENNEVIATSESVSFRIAHLGVLVSIDSLRATEKAHIGGKITGWLRIRRNTDMGDPALISLSFVYPGGEEYEVLKQEVKQSKNLSLAFGPLKVPEPKSIGSPSSVSLVARLSYAGVEQDTRSTEIELRGESRPDIARMSFSGVPNFVLPNQFLRAACHITNSTDADLIGQLSVELESVAGTDVLLNQKVTLKPNEPRTFAVSLHVPPSAEMSTAHLKAMLRTGDRTLETRTRLKIKAIDEPYYKVKFLTKSKTGEDLPGLIPKMTPIYLGIHITQLKDELDDVEALIRVVSRRKVVDEFRVSGFVEKEEYLEALIEWTTPAVDMVTGFYLDCVLFQKGRQLPSRAIDLIKKQFTVY